MTKIKIKASQSPFWLFSEDYDGMMQMFSDKGFPVGLWVRKELFDERVKDGTYQVIEE